MRSPAQLRLSSSVEHLFTSHKSRVDPLTPPPFSMELLFARVVSTPIRFAGHDARHCIRSEGFENSHLHSLRCAEIACAIAKRSSSVSAVRKPGIATLFEGEGNVECELLFEGPCGHERLPGQRGLF